MAAAGMPIGMRMRAREDGFSLIELLVVVLVLGALAALAFPSFVNQKGKANDTEAKNNLQVTQRAMETYFLDHDTYATANMNASSDPDSLLQDRGDARRLSDAVDHRSGDEHVHDQRRLGLQPVRDLHPEAQIERRGRPHLHAGLHRRLQLRRHLVARLDATPRSAAASTSRR